MTHSSNARLTVNTGFGRDVAAKITRTRSRNDSERAIDATRAYLAKFRGYAGSLAPRTSSGSIVGGVANSAGACAIRACAMGPFR